MSAGNEGVVENRPGSRSISQSSPPSAVAMETMQQAHLNSRRLRTWLPTYLLPYFLFIFKRD